jgi:HAMP domain-containing protein
MVADIADKGIDRQLHELGWKAYDTVIGAANNTTNRVFTSPAVGQMLGGAIDIMLRYQRFNAAVAGAFFSALWPAVGLPSATEVEAMRGEVRAMREELRDAVADRDSKDEFASELHIAVRESIVNQQADEKSAARETNGDAHAAMPAKKSSVYQFSVWSGWPGADPMELSEDVGN